MAKTVFPEHTDYLDEGGDTSVRSAKDRRQVREAQFEARQANYQAPQDLDVQTVRGENDKGKDLDFQLTAVGQDLYLEIGEARVKITRERALQLQKMARRASAATA